MLQQKLMLVQQHEVTIAVGEVPILCNGNVGFNSMHSASIDAINFLRSGSPAVQITHNEDHNSEMMLKDSADKMKEYVDNFLNEFRLPEEEFHTELNGRVLLVTRKIIEDRGSDTEFEFKKRSK